MDEKIEGKVLLSRTCDKDLKSYGGFQWPESGYVEAPDWDGGKPVCGGKLHGFLWGVGRGSLASWEPDARWLVVAADPADVVEITQDGGGKHGFRRGEVVHCGDRASATAFILANGAAGNAVIGAVVSVGNMGTATAGYGGTATAGYGGTATAGDRGTATAGDGGVLSIAWRDLKAGKYRRRIGCVGEGGLKAGIKYRVVDGEFSEAKD